MNQHKRHYTIIKQYKKEPWYKKNILKYIKEQKNEFILWLVIVLVFILWYFLKKDKFEWIEYELIGNIPFVRRILSSLTFFSIWAFLYFIRFYQLLHIILVQIFGMKKFYKELKAFIWWFLMLFMYFKFAPFVIWVWNQIISFFINILNIILYLFPPLWISIILIIVYFSLKHYKKI